MGFKGYSLSVKGASHEDDGSGCQDSARVYIGDEFAIAAVSDGHGSEKHFRSAAGSEMATRVSIRSICDFWERNGGLDDILQNDQKKAARRIAANIICGWNSEINAHLSLIPLTPKEKSIYDKYNGITDEVMYGATLIAAVITRRGCFGLQIGDGNFCASDGEKMLFPMPNDSKLIGNFTTSLCDNNAIGNFRCFYRTGPFAGVMLSSDGLINSFVNTDDYLKFGRRVLNAIESNSTADLGRHLKTRSRQGSRDDISVAALIPTP